MTWALRLLAILLWLASREPALAHEVRPGYLELRQTGADVYDVLWKVPGRGDDLRLGLYVEFPAGSENRQRAARPFGANAFTERWSVKRAGRTGRRHDPHRRPHRNR